MDALSQCIDFLGAIFEPEDIIEFRPLPPAAGRRWSTLTEIPDIIDWLERLNRDENQRVHAYFGGNPRKAKNASQAEGVALARCVFADFDGGVVVEDALARVRAAGAKPCKDPFFPANCSTRPSISFMENSPAGVPRES